MIVLDLADVGMAQGPSTLMLARAIRAKLPGLHLIGGGGIRHEGDLQTLAAAGYEAALVASALHDGHILPGRHQS
jgi:phosphoribosylformimino-5-aminoimidazole carboxamide ribotide isomerase